MKIFSETTLTIFIIIVIFFLCFYFAKNILAPDIKQYSLGSVCFKNKCFQVELAETGAQRDRGLMYRKELDRDAGMFFVFEKDGIYPFWMKDTYIPLDIIWIDVNNKVVFISQNVQPCKSLICPSIIPPFKAKYVLEVNAGLCGEIDLKIGDKLQLNLQL